MMKSSILNTISIDIVEMIIISSKDYKLFKTLRLLLIKLNEDNRTIRIKDKLTICVNGGNGAYRYYLNNKSHREYDKPSVIENINMRWRKHSKENRINGNPSIIRFEYIGGMSINHRNWFYMRMNGYPNYIHFNGSMCWHKNHLTLKQIKNIWNTGHRDCFNDNTYTYGTVFDYLRETYRVSITKTK